MRGIVVLDALGDSELKFQRVSQVWNRATSDAVCPTATTRPASESPTAREIAQAETVTDWLAWLGHHHGGVWAHDDPIWRWLSGSDAASGRSTTGSTTRSR